MPIIEVQVTDQELRIIKAVRKLRGCDCAFRVTVRDIVQNQAGIDYSLGEAYVELAIAALEERVQALEDAKVVPEPEPAPAPASPEPEAIEPEAPAPIQVNEPDAPLPLFELTPPPTTDEAPQVITEI